MIKLFNIKETKVKFYVQNGKQCLEFVAVGVTFDNKQQILQELFQLNICNPDVKIKVKLQLQQDNKFDPNAIKIVLKDGRSIGYVSKQYNSDFKNVIDKILDAYIEQIYMNNKRIYNAKIKLVFENEQ